MKFLEQCLPLLFLIFLSVQNYGKATSFDSYDVGSCVELCDDCDGEAYVVDDSCTCYFGENNQLATDCVSRLRRNAQSLELEQMPSDIGDLSMDRAARCLAHGRRFGILGNGDQFANYFANGYSTLLGAPNPNSPSINPGTQLESEAGNDATPIVGSSNPNENGATVGSSQMPYQPTLFNRFNWNPRLGATNPTYGRYNSGSQSKVTATKSEAKSKTDVNIDEESDDAALGSKHDSIEPAKEEDDHSESVNGEAKSIESK